MALVVCSKNRKGEYKMDKNSLEYPWDKVDWKKDATEEIINLINAGADINAKGGYKNRTALMRIVEKASDKEKDDNDNSKEKEGGVDKDESKSEDTSPKTGDESGIAQYLSLCISGAFVILAIVCQYIYKRNRN